MSGKGLSRRHALVTSYANAIGAYGYQVQTRVLTETCSVICVPCCSFDEKNHEVCVITAGCETVTVYTDPLTGVKETICTCVGFRKGMIALATEMPGSDSEPKWDMRLECIHTLWRAALYDPCVSDDAARRAQVMDKWPVMSRIITDGKMALNQVVHEFRSVSSKLQFFTVLDSQRSMPIFGPRNVQRLRVTPLVNGYKVRCMSQLCGQLGDVTIDQADFSADSQFYGITQTVCSHVKDLLSSVTARHVNLVQAPATGALRANDGPPNANSSDSSTAIAATVVGQDDIYSGFDEIAGEYTLHRSSFWWEHRMSDTDVALTLEQLKDYILDPEAGVPKEVRTLSSLLQSHKAQHFVPGENGIVTVCNLTTMGLYKGPDLLAPGHGHVCKKCNDVLSDSGLTIESGSHRGVLALYTELGGFECKVHYNVCQTCGHVVKWTGHQFASLRHTQDTAFSMSLFLEHVVRVKKSTGTQTFSHFIESLTRNFALPHPDAHIMPNKALFIDWWFTVVSGMRLRFTSTIKCPAHDYDCPHICLDGTALGPKRSVLADCVPHNMHAANVPTGSSRRGGLPNISVGRYQRSPIPNPDDNRLTQTQKAACKKEAQNVRYSIRIICQHAIACVCARDILPTNEVGADLTGPASGIGHHNSSSGSSDENSDGGNDCDDDVSGAAESTTGTPTLAAKGPTASPKLKCKCKASEVAKCCGILLGAISCYDNSVGVPTRHVLPANLVELVRHVVKYTDPERVHPPSKTELDVLEVSARALILFGAECSVTSMLHPEHAFEFKKRLDAACQNKTDKTVVAALRDLCRTTLRLPEISNCITVEFVVHGLVSDRLLQALQHMLERCGRVEDISRVADPEWQVPVNTPPVKARNPVKSATFYYLDESGGQVRNVGHVREDTTVGVAANYDTAPAKDTACRKKFDGKKSGLTGLFTAFCTLSGDTGLLHTCYACPKI